MSKKSLFFLSLFIFCIYACRHTQLTKTQYADGKKMCEKLQAAGKGDEYKKDKIDNCTKDLFYSCSVQQFKIAGKYVDCVRGGKSDDTCRERDNDKCIDVIIKALKGG